MTAAALDLADARPLYRWRDGIEPKEQAAADRLRLLFRIGYEVERAYGPRVRDLLGDPGRQGDGGRQRHQHGQQRCLVDEQGHLGLPEQGGRVAGDSQRG